MRFFVCAALWSLSCGACYAQLYLITGHPTGNLYQAPYDSQLLRVAGDAVTPVADIVPKGTGTSWIAVSYDARKAVVLQGWHDRSKTIVLDFDMAAVAKTCVPPPEPTKGSRVGEWLVDAPGKGLSVVSQIFGKDLTDIALYGMILDPSVSCRDSFFVLPPAELRFVVAHGYAGTYGNTVNDGFIGNLGSNNVITGGTERFPFDYQVPAPLVEGLPDRGCYIVCNNGQVLVVRAGGGKESEERLLVFRKSDRTWRRVPIKQGRFIWTRAFGQFIVVKEGWDKGAERKESAGREKWRRKESTRGPNIEERLTASPHVFPGRLHIYDAKTERVYTITTNQGDSEVLLIANNTVYYRASDRLYRAAITENGVGAATLVATSELIPDAHWAFLRQ